MPENAIHLFFKNPVYLLFIRQNIAGQPIKSSNLHLAGIPVTPIFPRLFSGNRLKITYILKQKMLLNLNIMRICKNKSAFCKKSVKKIKKAEILAAERWAGIKPVGWEY